MCKQWNVALTWNRAGKPKQKHNNRSLCASSVGGGNITGIHLTNCILKYNNWTQRAKDYSRELPGSSRDMLGFSPTNSRKLLVRTTSHYSSTTKNSHTTFTLLDFTISQYGALHRSQAAKSAADHSENQSVQLPRVGQQEALRCPVSASDHFTFYRFNLVQR